jgi:DNA invertase Pin-like site-specific DNA recombinase
MDGKFIAYYRVSTDRQGMNGNGMAAQRKAVEDYLNGGRWKLVGEFTEVESGKRSDRPELEKALTACRKHKAKLVIAKLDRLSGNVHFISGLMERKVDFVACDMPSANAFMINVYAAVAQEERHMISDRTKAALAAAKRRGVKLGGPKLPVINATRRMAALERARAIAPVHGLKLHPLGLGYKTDRATVLRALVAASSPLEFRPIRHIDCPATNVSREKQ